MKSVEEASFRIREGGGLIFFGGILNLKAFFRIFESFDRPDANSDGLVTISDIGTHAKETFFATGDVVAEFLAGTDFGQFFEMSTSTPSAGLSFFVSAAMWISLYLGLKILITGKNY